MYQYTGYICINSRRRSVTIRDFLQKHKIKLVKFHISGKPNQEKLFPKLRENNVEIMGNSSPIII